MILFCWEVVREGISRRTGVPEWVLDIWAQIVWSVRPYDWLEPEEFYIMLYGED